MVGIPYADKIKNRDLNSFFNPEMSDLEREKVKRRVNQYSGVSEESFEDFKVKVLDLRSLMIALFKEDQNYFLHENKELIRQVLHVHPVILRVDVRNPTVASMMQFAIVSQQVIEALNLNGAKHGIDYEMEEIK